MSHLRDRRSFGHHVADDAEFKELWNDYEHMRGLHQIGHLDVATIGLGLRGAPGETPRPAIVLQTGKRAPRTLPLRSPSGFPIFVEHIDDVQAGPLATVSADTPFTKQYPTPPGGVSIAPIQTNYAGTLGCFVRCKGEMDKNKGFILSNRHVLDPSFTGATGGPGIQQQAYVDGNLSGKSIASLSYVAAVYPDSQADLNVDAALAFVSPGKYDPRILTGQDSAPYAPLTTPNTIPLAGESVLKSGRTSGRTVGVVDLVTAQTRTKYTDTTKILFTDCIAVVNTSEAFQKPGDSGALLTNAACQPLGLMFAIGKDSTTGKHYAYANRIATVLAALKTAAGVEFEIVTGSGSVSEVPMAALEPAQ